MWHTSSEDPSKQCLCCECPKTEIRRNRAFNSSRLAVQKVFTNSVSLVCVYVTGVPSRTMPFLGPHGTAFYLAN